MVGMDSYMNAYLDRRMKNLIQDWDLATQNDIGDFETRLRAIEETTKQIESFETSAKIKIDNLEERLSRLREAKR
jgi:polyhydroxyalkanoate synthesis regulator phasin